MTPLDPKALAAAETVKELARRDTEIAELLLERDEARKEAKSLTDSIQRCWLKESQDKALLDKLGRQLAALIEALEELETFPEWGGREPADFGAFTKWVQGVAGKALADTAGDGAQYQRMDDDRVFIISQHWGFVTELLEEYFSERYRPERYPQWYKDMLAAGPAKPEPEDGE